MVGAQRNPFLLLEQGGILRGRKGNNLLVHAYRTNSLYFSFSFFVSIFPLIFPFFSFSLFFYFVISLRWLLLWFLPLFCYCSSLFAHGKGLLLQRLSWPDFTVLALNHLCLVWVYLPTTTGPFMCHSPSPDKDDYFVCQSVMLWCGFSLPILHGMNLVAPAQFCPFGWCVISVGHFPQKSPGRNLKIGFPLSPPPNHTRLHLTHDLTASCIGWVQAGEAQALRVPFFHMSKICLSLTHPPCSGGLPA